MSSGVRNDDGRAMKSQFYELAARLERELAPGEALLCNLSAER